MVMIEALAYWLAAALTAAGASWAYGIPPLTGILDHMVVLAAVSVLAFLCNAACDVGGTVAGSMTTGRDDRDMRGHPFALCCAGITFLIGWAGLGACVGHMLDESWAHGVVVLTIGVPLFFAGTTLTGLSVSVILEQVTGQSGEHATDKR